MAKDAPKCPNCKNKMTELGGQGKSGIYDCRVCADQYVCLPKSIFTVH